MNDKLTSSTLLADDLDKVQNVLPGVLIIDTKSALDCDWNRDLLLHLLHNSGYQVWVLHQDSTECPFDDFVGRTATVDVDFIVAELLGYLGCLAHRHWVTATELEHYWVLAL